MTFEDIRHDLLLIVSEAGARPDVPTESRRFFTSIVERFGDDREACLDYVRANLTSWFRCVGREPDWIQEPHWQFDENKPMVFVGQVDVHHSLGWFHDEARFFVFWNPENGETRTVIQVS